MGREQKGREDHYEERERGRIITGGVKVRRLRSCMQVQYVHTYTQDDVCAVWYG